MPENLSLHNDGWQIWNQKLVFDLAGQQALSAGESRRPRGLNR